MEVVQKEVVARASSARNRAQAIRSIAFERKHSRHARSIIVRGVLHTVYTVVLGIATMDSTNNYPYYTKHAVADALTAPYANVYKLYGDTTKRISCDERNNHTFMTERSRSLSNHHGRPDSMQRLKEVSVWRSMLHVLKR